MAKTEDSRAKHRAYMRVWRAANLEKARANNRAWQIKNPQKQAYGVHKVRAKLRGIPFSLTFEEWWAIWHESGKWDQRGSRRGQYVMARHRDLGAYAVGNVRICTAEENNSEQALYLTERTRQLRSDNAKRQHQVDPLIKARLKLLAEAGISAETRAKRSKAAKAQWARKKAAHS